MSQNHEKIILLSAIALIMLIGLANLHHQHSLNAINDEFAYWANAAQMAGKDWTALLSTSSFYSYGYSFLLVPMFWLGFTATLMYRIALVFNVILLILSFLLTVWLARKLFGDKTDRRFLIFLSFIITLYPYNIYQMHLAWTELFLTFLFWAIAALFYRIFCAKKPQVLDLTLLSMASVYIYTVHNRALGVTLAVFFLLLFLYLKSIREKNAQHRFLFALIFIIVLFIGASIFRQYTIVNWYLPETNTIIHLNDYSGQAHKITRLATFQGVVNLSLSLAGKIFYQATTTFLLALLPIISFISMIFTWIFTSMVGWFKGKLKFPLMQVKQADSRKNREKWDTKKWLFFFCTLTYLLEIGITAIYKSGSLSNLRIADILYGRYPEFAIGPVLLFGFAIVLKMHPLLGTISAIPPRKERFAFSKLIIATVSTYLILAVPVAYQLINAGIKFLNPLSGVRYFFKNQDSMISATLHMTLTALLGFTLFSGCIWLVQKGLPEKLLAKISNQSFIAKNILGNLKIVALTLIGIYWLGYGYNVAKDYLVVEKAADYECVAAIDEALKEFDDAAKIYYVTDFADPSYRYLKILQSLQPDRMIRLISLEEALSAFASKDYEASKEASSLAKPPTENDIIMSGINLEIMNELLNETEIFVFSNGLAIYAPIRPSSPTFR